MEKSVMDKAMSPPRVGAVTEFPLCFSEIRSSPSDAPKRDVVTVRGVLDLDARGPTHIADTGTSDGRWWWRGVLRGDGWSATWHGERPRTGHVEVTGQFSSGLHLDTGRVRGRITRVQLITVAYRQTADGGWETETEAPWSYRDVEVMPQGFDHDPTLNSDGLCIWDTAGLIDLDLDDVPPAQLRPRIVPSSLSADGDSLWVVDAELPIVVRYEPARAQATEYLLPAPSEAFHSVAAASLGCWFFGESGLFWIPIAGAGQLIDSRRVVHIAAHGDVVLVQTDDDVWTIHRVDSAPITVDLAVASDAVTSIGIDDAVSPGWIVALHMWDKTSGATRLFRVSTTGTVTVGPKLSSPTRYAPMFLAGKPLRLFLGRQVATVNNDLTLAPAEELADEPLYGGCLGDEAWISAVVSGFDGDTSPDNMRSHALSGGPQERRVVVTIIDPCTLVTLHRWYVDRTPIRIARNNQGFWLCENRRLIRLPDPPAQAQQVVDVAEMVRDSVLPAGPGTDGGQGWR
ncbi:hypothetical protein [Gordonia polyisoprenivorans]|uniref:hypothetical protein n=1 Tax=Gordonia polyisoprenivorans TaxID=84595 RepID=UPI0030D2F8D9